MLKHCLAEVDGDFHDVSEWTELHIRCLVTRLMGCAVRRQVDKRPEVVAASAAARVRYEVSGNPLRGLRRRSADGDLN